MSEFFGKMAVRNATGRLAFIVLSVLIGSSAPVSATEATGTEMLFDTGTLNGVKIGSALKYSHVRSADENIPVRPIDDGQIIVSLHDEDGKPRTEVTLIDGKRKRKLQHFPLEKGNPIFVTFLESSVNAVKFATKGSPFYIRNRFKDAFAKGGTVTRSKLEFGGQEISAVTIEYRPFKDDENKEKLGAAFENLAVIFTLSGAVPGQFLSMTTKAETGGKQFFIEDVRFTNVTSFED